MKNRVEHVDIAKGISIILVALFHSKLSPLAPHVMNGMGLFRMPLFFFLSGVFFSASTASNIFYVKKGDALLKPYFTTLFLVLLLSALFGGSEYLSKFLGILYGNGVTLPKIWSPLWFLPHLFLTYAFTYQLVRITNIQNREAGSKFLVVLFLSIVGTQFIDIFWYTKISLGGGEIELPGLPFGLDIVCVSASFFISGAFLREMIIRFRPNVLLLICAIALFLIIVVFTDAHMDINKRVYRTPFFTTVGSICGIYGVMCVAFYCQRVDTLRKLFLVFGQSSLFILIFHLPIGVGVYTLLKRFDTNTLDPLFALISFIISISAPLAIKALVQRNRYLSLLYFPLKREK